MQSIELVFERATLNRIGRESTNKQIEKIANSCKNRAQAAGVTGEASDEVYNKEVNENGVNKYQHSFKLLLKKDKYRTESAALKCLEHGKKFAMRAGEASGWVCRGDVQDQSNREAAAELRTPMIYRSLDDAAYAEYFEGIYEREPHARLIHASTFTFIESEKEERNHTLLFGEPAACKSELFSRFKRFYDDDCERVAVINASTLSKAGLENWLLEKSKDGLLPDIIWFDEIEKFSNETDLSCLLQIMDGQGKIAKMNARIGKQEANARVLVWGTCNNDEKLKKWNAGALWSRFTKKLECVRPSRELMTKILLVRIAERRSRGRNAKDQWAKAAVDYAFDVAKSNDPRFVLGLLDGGDGLLNGSYFADIEAVAKAAKLAHDAKRSGIFK